VTSFHPMYRVTLSVVVDHPSYVKWRERLVHEYHSFVHCALPVCLLSCRRPLWYWHAVWCTHLVDESACFCSFLIKPRLHDTTGCQTRCQTGPVVKPVWQPVWQSFGCLFTRYSRLSNRLHNLFDNRLYRVNGVLQSSHVCRSQRGRATLSII